MCCEGNYQQKLRLLNVTANDCDIIFQLANDPIVRKVSFYPDPIRRELHKHWFHSKLQDRNCVFFIAKNCSEENVGQIRFDIKNDIAIISISLGKEFRGYGLGCKMIKMACEKIFKMRDINYIHAIIKDNNTASIKTFQKVGFKKLQNIKYCGCPAILMGCKKL